MMFTMFLALSQYLPVSAASYEVAQRHPGANDAGPGTPAQPWKTIARAAERVASGDTVIIRDGIYRERVVIKASGRAEAPIRFQAAPGAHVVVTGADPLTGWVREGGQKPIYRVSWPQRFVTWSKHMTHPDDEYHRLIGRCEQVAIDGYLLRQVLEPGQLAPGTFLADTTSQALLVWDNAGRDLNKVFAEASARQEILRVEGDFIQVRGLRFRFAANMAQHGAVVLSGNSDVFEDCTSEATNSSGASFSGRHHIVRRCVFRDNGQLGFGAAGAHDLLFTECLVENNNTKGFDRGWEAGGDKIVLTRDAVIERSRFVRNRGNGLWFDIGNENCTVRQCFIADNEDSGIFYEISFGLHAQDNVITGNGFSQTAGAWGAQAGISLSSSPNCLIERNLIVGNREGFDFREQTRTTSRIGNSKEEAVWNHDERIQHNIIAWNRDAQVWGWFDVKDDRHWPASAATALPSGDVPSSPRIDDIAARYQATDARGQPTGLTLQKLRLQFVENIFFAAPGQACFEWGPSWSKHKSYSSVAEFQSGLGLDLAGRELDPGFADPLSHDYRLSQEMMSQLRQSYPVGPVLDVRLGEIPPQPSPEMRR
jgi:hypothetical protein